MEHQWFSIARKTDVAVRKPRVEVRAGSIWKMGLVIAAEFLCLLFGVRKCIGLTSLIWKCHLIRDQGAQDPAAFVEAGVPRAPPKWGGPCECGRVSGTRN
eukprot:COSAG05_NODE_157_length_15666_cov_29.830410_5_plen_100_part_00